MCGRYVTPTQAALERYFSDVGDWWRDVPNFDARPSQHLPILTGFDGGVPVVRSAHWSLLPPTLVSVRAWRYSTVNLQVEKLDEARSMAHRRFAGGRCLVPMAGYYEWSALKNSAQTLRVYVHPANDGLWFAAGLYGAFRADDGEHGFSFAILTGAANDRLRRLHNRGQNKHRMPMFIRPGDIDVWLNGDTRRARSLLTALDDDEVAAYRVERNLGNRPAQADSRGEVPWDDLAP